ncbi:efflux RND transporter periplasmic adaptor subunit [Gracilimonas tropica]|uniref:efflux RND transporter periplasmic adaptor subunit n=1 Tax=Gracilimonas tropica TaxID=454600 RepID=UPI00035EBB45|nr:efflux RND transporter periplasmic adaptor subunit [Gracilimonas tropica]
MKHPKYIPLLYCILITATLFTACKTEEESPDVPDMDSVEIRPEVVFDVVDDKPLNFYIESRGVVEPLQQTKIVPRISGYVESHIIEEGRQVDKGEVLLQFVDDEWEYEVEQARQAYLKAKNQYEIDKRLREGYSGESNDEMIRINSGLAEAEVAYDRAKLNLSYTTIKAPFSGRLSLQDVVTNQGFISVGSYVSAGTELASLIDAATVRIRFDVLESEINNLEKGMEVELFGPEGTEYRGQIIAISPEVNPDTKTGQVLVEVDNSEYGLKTGMTVDGRVFVRSQKSKVRMPREALLERDGRTLVFRLLNNEEVEWIYVTPVAMNSDYVLIDHEDINPGDTLAVDQHFSISHQQKVVPLLVD